ncbi:DASS family sodium-coupled anion symporter [Fulvivirga sp. 29W222]|uniref:DASS family sodium-coupled anion symporter n=1 Tax=Fulvivirga marina TaxID=2494733 RepID=A0A937FVB8_9BACT|nr:DASS family sodium-coupled anion symporter [Fulvivirga marina]MBL6444921.1 DASS family sodium-coupled anion symporter [Fulvivirga marina]
MKKHNWLLIFLGPIIFFILLQLQHSSYLTPEIWRVLALTAWMVTWWITEAVPIPVTALLPMIMLPLLQIFKIAEATAPYASPIIFLFMGGFMIAIALEKHNLHLRIALNLIKITGTSGNGIILGFMLSTALLSMWISNTATAVMMLPVAASVINLLIENTSSTKVYKNFALSLMLSIAYAANIGGTMTLIGTPPNIVMAGYLRQMLGYEMEFSRWLLMGVPIGLFLLFACYFLLTRVLFPNHMKNIKGSEEVITGKLNQLGSISREEAIVLAIFAITAACWVFKSQLNKLVGSDLLSDTTIAMAGGALMFIVPVSLNKSTFLLQWEDTTKLPWGILILFGGGMCLAKSLEHVGIIQLIGKAVSSYHGASLIVLILVITAIVLLMTELMSNVALVAIFIPVVIGVAKGLDLNALVLVIPATLASSCAFMMPISTPPNAIVFASGHIRMRDMMKAGIWLNIVAIIILTMATYWLVNLIFI